MATNKDWYLRRENTSKYLKDPYLYYVGGDDCWTTNIDKAKKYRTKKQVTALSLEIGGEVYGE